MIISFDIWDTIIKRKCHPEEVKLYTAKYLLLKYGEYLKDEYKDIYKILLKRDEIEANICKENKENGKDDECKIIDVFKKLQEEIFKENYKDISKELLQEEIEQEKRVIYINPEILPIFDKYKDLKMYCISDFYMDEKSLRELLDYLKLPIKIEKIYSSADYLLNKRIGNLFKKAEEDLKITPKEHIHVGDNQYSDIEVAQSLGIKTIKMNKSQFEFIPEQGRKMNYNLNMVKKDKNEDIFNAGVDLAPLIYFFVYSIVEYAIKNKIKKVYYFTREGETFIKIHEIFKRQNPFGVEIPECEILEVSRMATFSASLNEFSINELMRLWSQYRKQSMSTLFKTLAIDINNYTKYFKEYDIDIKEDIQDPWFDLRIQKLFKNKEFTENVNKELQSKKTELLKYFKEQKNIENDDEQMFVVDIGWRGTIQDNLAYIFDKKQIEGYYLTLYDFYNLQPENTKKNSFIDDIKIRDNEVASMITLIEWIYNPGTGSTIEYKDGVAIRKAKEKERNVVSKYIKPLQDGMFAGAKVINEYMTYHPYEAKETKKVVYDLIKDVKVNPSPSLLEAYYSMVFNDTFGTSEYIEKDDKLSLIQKLNIFKCRNILRNEPWKEAFIVYNNLWYMVWLMKVKSLVRKLTGRK